MTIPNKQFIYKNIYSYDIPSCHYNILKNSDYDISHIDPNNKIARNIAIGKMMINNPTLIKFLRNTTTEIVDFYINNNFLSPKDILLKQYDGFYSTKSINTNIIHNFPAKIKLKNLYDIFIFSINKKMYLGLDCHQNDILIKGIPARYDEIDKFYKKVLNINFLNSKSIVQTLKKLKYYFFNTDKINLFMIPTEKKYKIFTKEYGELTFSKKAIDLMGIDEIDRIKYFEIYLEPFFKSIIYHVF